MSGSAARPGPELPSAEELAALAERSAPGAATALLGVLDRLADPANAAGMARFGISPTGTLGVSMAALRPIARGLLRSRRRDGAWRHETAAALWASGVHEARILGVLLEDPALVTREQALAWATDSDSWDITDQLCMKLLDRTPFAYELAEEWSTAEPEFVKRAAFALMASLAWHDKTAPDERFLPFLGTIEREASDPRNFVTKAVDWALRQIGKRSENLRGPALAAADRLATSDDRAARRVGRVSAKELRR